MNFIGRDSRQAIRNCLKRNPKYLHYHLGRQLDASKFVLATQPINHAQGTIVIYDNCNYYAEYLKTNQ